MLCQLARFRKNKYIEPLLKMLQEKGYHRSLQVVLSQNNFIVIGFVKGEAKGFSIFGIGGSQRKLTRRAKQRMLAQADIINKPRVIIDETISSRRTLLSFIKKVTVSGQIIEFID